MQHPILSLDKRGHIRQRESTTLEFKVEFKWEANFIQKVLRTIAGFANHQGGTIAFGIKNQPHTLVGIDENFRELHQDKKRLNEKINNFFAPAINWEAEIQEIGDIEIGLIIVQESSAKPIICCKAGESGILAESAIYYRYQAETTQIRYADLHHLLEREKEKERKQWFSLLGKIAKVGVKNVGLLDLATGKVTGNSNSFFIDETLLDKLQFIREGSFSETEGEPTMRLLGNVHPTTPLIGQPIPVSNLGKLKPSEVASEVSKLLNEKGIQRDFTTTLHTNCWRCYKVRPGNNATNKEKTTAKFCTYDAPHDDYVYTKEWVNFLVEKMSDENEYLKVKNYRPPPPVS